MYNNYYVGKMSFLLLYNNYNNTAQQIPENAPYGWNTYLLLFEIAASISEVKKGVPHQILLFCKFP